MPVNSADSSALISGVAQLGAAGISAASAAVQNKKSYEYSRRLAEDNMALWEKSLPIQMQYNKQVADYALEQDVKLWKAQNEYNSPSAQMDRYRQAGLNPNLIYGNQNLSQNRPDYSLSDPSGFSAGQGQFTYNSPLDAISRGMSEIGNAISNINALRSQAETFRTQKLANDVQSAKVDAAGGSSRLGFFQALDELTNHQSNAYIARGNGLMSMYDLFTRAGKAAWDASSSVRIATGDYLQPLENAQIKLELANAEKELDMAKHKKQIDWKSYEIQKNSLDLSRKKLNQEIELQKKAQSLDYYKFSQNLDWDREKFNSTFNLDKDRFDFDKYARDIELRANHRYDYFRNRPSEGWFTDTSDFLMCFIDMIKSFIPLTK